jgi:hypothetical protein
MSFSLSDTQLKKNSAGSSLAEQLVRERIALLKAAWNDTHYYACDCDTPALVKTHGTNSLACCRSYEDDSSFTATEPCTCLDGETSSTACCANNFMPDRLGGVLFDEIPAEDVVGKIMELIDPYIKKILTEPGNNAFTKYNDPEKVAKWNWVSSGMGESATKASGLYSTLDPIMFYNASEAGYPFRANTTIWEMCSGLVGQVTTCHIVVMAGWAHNHSVL